MNQKGVLLSVPETMSEVSCMKKLWIHEVLRVFYDRLVDAQDREWFLERVIESCTKYLDINFHKLLSYLDEGGDGEVTNIGN